MKNLLIILLGLSVVYNAYADKQGLIQEQEREDFLEAVENGDISAYNLTALQENTSEAKKHLETLNRALMSASSLGDTKIVSKLIKAGADVNYIEYDDRYYDHTAERTPLHTAVWENHVEVASQLLEAGASPNETVTFCRGCSYTAPLMVATLNGNKEMVRLLLEHGANMRQKDYYWDADRATDRVVTAYCVATMRGDAPIARIIYNAYTEGGKYTDGTSYIECEIPIK